MRGTLLCDSFLLHFAFDIYIYIYNDIVTELVYSVGHQYFMFVARRQFQRLKKANPFHAYKYLKVVVTSELEVDLQPKWIQNWKIEWDPSKDLLITMVDPIDLDKQAWQGIRNMMECL